jgi:hypothetical protein
MFLICLEGTTVSVPIGPRKNSFSIHFVKVEFSNECSTIRVSLLALPFLNVVAPGTLVNGLICEHKSALSVAIALHELTVVALVIRQHQNA